MDIHSREDGDMNQPEGTEDLSRRERLKREREQRILDAAAAVFGEKGYHRATVHDIAVAADVADGTIYNYFENKFDLLLGLLARIAELQQLPDELALGLQADVRDFFVAAFRDRMGRIAQGEEMLQAVLPQVLVNPELRDRFYRQWVLHITQLLEGYVQAQIERGRIRPLDARLMTRLLQSTFLGMLVMRLLGDEPLHESWAGIPEFWATILFDGLDPGDRG
jgi:TetR/AcrR family fatty acid metabolism transcriptional regulator